MLDTTGPKYVFIMNFLDTRWSKYSIKSVKISLLAKEGSLDHKNLDFGIFDVFESSYFYVQCYVQCYVMNFRSHRQLREQKELSSKISTPLEYLVRYFSLVNKEK